VFFWFAKLNKVRVLKKQDNFMTVLGNFDALPLKITAGAEAVMSLIALVGKGQ